MPDEVSNIGVRLTLDASGFTAPLKTATGALNTFQQQAARAASGVAATRAGGGRNAAPGTAVSGGMSVPVDLTVNEASLLKLRSQITKGIGAVPVTITPQFAPTGRWSVQNIMGSMLSMQYGVSATRGSQIAKQSIEKVLGPMPKRALGGPVAAHQPVVVGEMGRAEVFVPKTSGRIEPSVTEYYRKQERLRRQEAELAAVEYQRQREHERRMGRLRGGRVAPLPPGTPMPPAFGTAPLREGYVRGYHYTRGSFDPATQTVTAPAGENLADIRRHGLRLSKALGNTYGEPNAIWFSNDPRGYDEKYAVEAHLPARWFTNRWGPRRSTDPWTVGGPDSNMAVEGNISRRRIASWNEPWMRDYRYLMDYIGRPGGTLHPEPYTAAAVMREMGPSVRHMRGSGNATYENAAKGYDQFVAEAWRARHRVRGGKIAGYGGKYGGATPGSVRDWSETQEQLWGEAFGEPGWLYHATDRLPEIRGRYRQEGLGVGVQPLSPGRWGKPNVPISFWATSPSPNYGHEVVRTPRPYGPASDFFEMAPTVFSTEHPVPRSRLQYWGQDAAWHRFRRGRARAGGGEVEAFEARAIKMFGLTHDIREAGYLTPSGKYLDFSGRSQAGGYIRQGDRFVPGGRYGDRDYLAGQRSMDHREALALFPRRARAYDSEPIDWMMDKGFIRVGGDYETGVSAEFSRPTTQAQYARLVAEGMQARHAYVDVSSGVGKRLASFETMWPEDPIGGRKMAAFLRSANELLSRAGRAGGGTVEAGLTRRQRAYTANVRRAAADLRPEHFALGATWYARAESWIADTARKYGVPEPVVRGMTASLSASTDWNANKTKVERMLAAMTGGRGSPYARTFHPHAKAENMFRSWQANPAFDPWSMLSHTPKTGQFYLNTGGDLNALTIDRWALRTATLGKVSEAGVGPLRRGVSAAFLRVAKEHEIAPAQLQAALWLREKELAAIAQGRKYDLSKMAAGGRAFYAAPKGAVLAEPWRPERHVLEAINDIRRPELTLEHGLSIKPAGTEIEAWDIAGHEADVRQMSEEGIKKFLSERGWRPTFTPAEYEQKQRELAQSAKKTYGYESRFTPRLVSDTRPQQLITARDIGDENSVAISDTQPITVHSHPAGPAGGDWTRPSYADIRSFLLKRERESWIVTPHGTAILRQLGTPPNTRFDASEYIRKTLKRRGIDPFNVPDEAETNLRMWDPIMGRIAKEMQFEYLRFPRDLTQIPEGFPVERLPFEFPGRQMPLRFRARGGRARLARDFVGRPWTPPEWIPPQDRVLGHPVPAVPWTGSQSVVEQTARWMFLNAHMPKGQQPGWPSPKPWRPEAHPYWRATGPGWRGRSSEDADMVMNRLLEEMGGGSLFSLSGKIDPWSGFRANRGLRFPLPAGARRRMALGGIVHPMAGFASSIFQTAADWASDPFMAIMAWQSQQQGKQRARGGRVEQVAAVIAELQRRYPKVTVSDIHTERRPWETYAARYLPNYRSGTTPAGESVVESGAISLNLAKRWDQRFVHPRGIEGTPTEAIATHEFGHALTMPLPFKAQRILAHAIERDTGKGTLIHRGWDNRYFWDQGEYFKPGARMVSSYAEKNFREAMADYFLASERQREEYRTPGVRAFGRALGRLGPLFRALGGEATKGLYIVGEIGPELFVPNRLVPLIPKRVRDQIPGAKSGMRVIGKKRNELFAPPEDGLIVPNRLMAQVPHAAGGRDFSDWPDDELLHGPGQRARERRSEAARRGWETRRAGTPQLEAQRVEVTGAREVTVGPPTGRMRLPIPEEEGGGQIEFPTGMLKQIQAYMGAGANSQLILDTFKEASRIGLSPKEQAALAERTTRRELAMDLTNMGAGVSSWQQVMSGRTPRGLVAQLSSMFGGGRREQYVLQAQFGEQQRAMRTALAVAPAGAVQKFREYIDLEAKSLGLRGKEADQARTRLRTMRTEDATLDDLVKKHEDLGRTYQKLQPTTGGIIRNLGVVIGATSAYGLAMSAANAALQPLMEGATSAVSRWYEQLAGFAPVATKATTALADQARQQNGNVTAAIAAKAATAGMSASVADWVERAASNSVTAKAAGKAYADASELFRAAIGAAGKTEGLYGGYGGLMGTAFLGTEMGGGKGVAEQVLLDIAAARGQAGYDITRPLISGAAGAGIGGVFGGPVGAAVGGVAGASYQILSDIVTGKMAQGGPLPEHPGEAETAVAKNVADAMARAQAREGGPQFGFAYKGQAALDTLMSSPDFAKLPEELKSLAKAGYAVTDSFGNIQTRFADIDAAWKQFATGLTITPVEVWAKTLDRQISAKFEAIDIAGAFNRTVTIPLGFALQRIQAPLAAAGAGVVPGAGLTATQARQIGVPTGLTGMGFFGGATTAGGMGLPPELARFATDLVDSAATMQEGFKIADKAARERAVAMIRSQAATVAGTQTRGAVQYSGPIGPGANGQPLPGQLLPRAQWTPIQTGPGEELVNQYNTAMDAAAGASAELKVLNDQIASLNAVAEQAQWANTTRLALRSISDAAGLLGQKGGSELGRIERSLYQIGRARQSLELQLNQYQINFQRAMAGFQAPGLTSEERAARQQQAEIEASYAQRQQNYAVEEFNLAGREWRIQAMRNLQDAQAAWAAARAGHNATVVAAAAQAKIAALTQTIQQNLQTASSIYDDSSTKYETSLQIATQAASEFGGTVAGQLTKIRTLGSVLGQSADGVRSFLEALGFTFRQTRTGVVVTPPNMAPSTETVYGGGRSAGYLGAFASGALMTVGEAGPETVAILRNPRTHMLSNPGGQSAPAAPVTVNLYLTVQGDVGSEATIAKITRAVEDSFNRKAARLGVRTYLSAT